MFELSAIQSLLEDSGIEIYQVHQHGQRHEIEVAERVRLHMMDSGVRVDVDDQLTLRFSARAQRSDAPSADAAQLFERVQAAVGVPVMARGFEERERRTVEIKDPVDESKVLDVWYEIVFAKTCDQDQLVEELRWVMDLERYVEG